MCHHAKWQKEEFWNSRGNDCAQNIWAESSEFDFHPAQAAKKERMKKNPHKNSRCNGQERCECLPWHRHSATKNKIKRRLETLSLKDNLGWGSFSLFCEIYIWLRMSNKYRKFSLLTRQECFISHEFLQQIETWDVVRAEHVGCSSTNKVLEDLFGLKLTCALLHTKLKFAQIFCTRLTFHVVSSTSYKFLRHCIIAIYSSKVEYMELSRL